MVGILGLVYNGELVPPIWFYGLVTRISSSKRFVDIKVKRSNIQLFKKKRDTLPLCFDHLTGWVESYDY